MTEDVSSYLAEANHVEQTGSKQRERHALKAQKPDKDLRFGGVCSSKKWLHLFGEVSIMLARPTPRCFGIRSAKLILAGRQDSFPIAQEKSFLSPRC
jgi:hypothetical protein